MSIISIANASMLGRRSRPSRIGGGVSGHNAPLCILIVALCATFATLNLPGEPKQPRYSGPWMRESDTFEIAHGWAWAASFAPEANLSLWRGQPVCQFSGTHNSNSGGQLWAHITKYCEPRSPIVFAHD